MFPVVLVLQFFNFQAISAMAWGTESCPKVSFWRQLLNEKKKKKKKYNPFIGLDCCLTFYGLIVVFIYVVVCLLLVVMQKIDALFAISNC